MPFTAISTTLAADSSAPEALTISSLIHTHYPGVEVAILTGSQAHRTELDRSKDIDVLLFSKHFRGVSLQAYKEKGLAIDFIKISTHTLSQLLADQAYDTTGTVLHMLLTGQVVHDATGVAASIQERAAQLYSCGHKELEQQLSGLQGRLRQLRKHLLKELGPSYDFFLIQEFNRLVSSAQLMAERGWAHGSVYGIDQLLALPNQFAANLMQLVSDFLTNPNSYRTSVIQYIDLYLNTPTSAHIRPSWSSRVVVSVSFIDNSVAGVITSLAILLAKPLASIQFRYCYWPNHKYSFPGTVALVFYCANELGTINALLHLLNTQQNKRQGQQIQSFQLVSAGYPDSLPEGSSEQQALDWLLTSVTSTMRHLTASCQLKHDEKYFVLLGVLLLTLLAQAADFSPLMAKYLLIYLASRWRHDERLIGNIDFVTTQSIYAELAEQDKEYYYLNKTMCHRLVRAAWLAPETIELTGWEIVAIQDQMRKFLLAGALAQTAPDPLDTGWSELNPVLFPASISRAYVYTIGAKQLLETLGLNQRQFSLVASIAAASLTSLPDNFG